MGYIAGGFAGRPCFRRAYGVVASAYASCDMAGCCGCRRGQAAPFDAARAVDAACFRGVRDSEHWNRDVCACAAGADRSVARDRSGVFLLPRVSVHHNARDSAAETPCRNAAKVLFVCRGVFIRVFRSGMAAWALVRAGHPHARIDVRHAARLHKLPARRIARFPLRFDLHDRRSCGEQPACACPGGVLRRDDARRQQTLRWSSRRAGT